MCPIQYQMMLLLVAYHLLPNHIKPYYDFYMV